MKGFQEHFECFFDVATCGDIISIYRGRPIWAGYHPDKLVLPAEILFNNVPSARGAVLHYIAKLVHEMVHLHFSEKERKEGTGKGIDYTNLEASVKQLISTLSSFKGEIKSNTSSFPLLLLQWLFELCADLSHQNHNRPYFNLQRPLPSVLLKAFQQIACIEDLLLLLESTFTEIESFPPNFAKNLLKIGADEFHAFCGELSRSNVQRAAQVHEEYSGRLRIYSDIFRCLERSRKLEFRLFILDVLNEFLLTNENLREFVFLVKLALVSPEVFTPYADEMIQIVLDRQLSPILTLLSQTPSFGLAMSNNLQLQNMITRILERASTNSLFKIIEFIGSFLSS
uniref:INTS5_N domain-containing protein n=1 Tax=Meloidogyne hapla TaxID=6305 RepID=A0A1I8BTG3_MELHA